MRHSMTIRNFDVRNLSCSPDSVVLHRRIHVDFHSEFCLKECLFFSYPGATRIFDFLWFQLVLHNQTFPVSILTFCYFLKFVLVRFSRP